MGGAASAAVFWWGPTASLVLGSAALCFFLYGVWGLFDRASSHAALANWTFSGKLLDLACALCAAMGVLAAGGLLFGVWAIALGTWIS